MNSDFVVIFVISCATQSDLKIHVEFVGNIFQQRDKEEHSPTLLSGNIRDAHHERQKHLNAMYQTDRPFVERLVSWQASFSFFLFSQC